MRKKLIIINACSITKKVVRDYNKLTDIEFKGKYQCSKDLYLRRAIKYGDPYMNAPLAKFGKLLGRLRF